LVADQRRQLAVLDRALLALLLAVAERGALAAPVEEARDEPGLLAAGDLHVRDQHAALPAFDLGDRPGAGLTAARAGAPRVPAVPRQLHLLAVDRAVGGPVRDRVRLARHRAPFFVLVGILDRKVELDLQQRLELLSTAHEGVRLVGGAARGQRSIRQRQRARVAGHAPADDLRDARRLDRGLARRRLAR